VRLYEISDGLAAIEEQILEAVMDGSDAQALTEMLATLKNEGEEQILDLARFYKNLRSSIEAIAAEKRRLTEMESNYKSKMEWLKCYVIAGMDAIGKTKVTDGVVKARQQKCPTKAVAKGQIPGRLAGKLTVGGKTVDVDLWMNAAEDLDPRYWRVDCKVDMAKKKIVDCWKETGEELPGSRIVDNEKTLVVQ